jgi:type I restriction enzyme S subunit
MVASTNCVWGTVQLSNEELFEFENGVWTGKKPPLVECAVLRNTNFGEEGTLDYSNVAKISIEERALSRKKLVPGDIIIERSGGGPTQPVGRVAYFDKQDAEFCFSNFTSRLRVRKPDTIDPCFLHLFLLFLYISGKTEALQRRTTGIRNLDFNEYLKTVVPLPPIDEQHSIAHLLQAVRKSKEARQSELELERERKAWLIDYLFIHGTSAEMGKPREIGGIPEGWMVVPLEEVAQIERGKFTHRPRNDPDFYGGTTPFIQTGDVTASNGHISSYSQTLNERGLSVSRVFSKGTIVITIAANIGFSAILDFDSAFPDSLIGLTPRTTVDAEYLNYYLAKQQPEMDRKAPRGTQKNINIEFLRPWPVLIPPLEEQRLIAKSLRCCDNKIESLQDEIRLLRELADAMLEELMTGRLSSVSLVEEHQRR